MMKSWCQTIEQSCVTLVKKGTRHQIKLSASLTSNKNPSIKEYQWNPLEDGARSQHYAIIYTISRLFIIKRRYGHVESGMDIDSEAGKRRPWHFLFLIRSVTDGKACFMPVCRCRYAIGVRPLLFPFSCVPFHKFQTNSYGRPAVVTVFFFFFMAGVIRAWFNRVIIIKRSFNYKFKWARHCSAWITSLHPTLECTHLL